MPGDSLLSISVSVHPDTPALAPRLDSAAAMPVASPHTPDSAAHAVNANTDVTPVAITSVPPTTPTAIPATGDSVGVTLPPADTVAMVSTSYVRAHAVSQWSDADAAHLYPVKYPRHACISECPIDTTSVALPWFDGLPHAQPRVSRDVFTVFFLLESFVFAYLIAHCGHYIVEKLRDFWRVKSYDGLFSDSASRGVLEGAFCQGLSMLNVAFFAYFATEPEVFLLTGFGVCLVLTLLFFGLRLLSYFYLSYTFLPPGEAAYLFAELRFVFAFVSFALFPLCVAYLYTPIPPFFITLSGIFVLFLFLVVKVFKIITIFCHTPRSLFYLILYLCGLEFLTLGGFVFALRHVFSV